MKSHRLESRTPIDEHQDLIANCGAIVKKARFLYTLDGDFVEGEEGLTASSCVKCQGVKPTQRYRYLIVPGTDERQAETT